jgi:hypothetical protein
LADRSVTSSTLNQLIHQRSIIRSIGDLINVQLFVDQSFNQRSIDRVIKYTMTVAFRLKVTQFDSLCQFELTWGQSQSLTARLQYPPHLEVLYQEWQRAYLNFYKSRSLLAEPIEPTLDSTVEPSPLRARVVNSGGLTTQVDWKARLDDAEKLLLRNFQNWLWQGELRDISRVIAAASQALGETVDHKIDVLLSCDPIHLVRLPWETWEITDNLEAFGKIRIVRSPVNIRAAAPPVHRPDWKRARILAICCDDAGLQLQQERAILKSLEPLVQVEFVGWSIGQHQRAEQVQQSILQAITDPQGWDILFFAGHSDETVMTGGRLAIAPGSSMTIEELKAALTQAKDRGLQLAMFNSCRGLRIAEALMDLGLNQVLVMRERIHNQVAQEFLVQFARSLASFKDTQDAVRDATQWLKENHNQRKYPSAYLVPSLFRRPGSPPIRLSQPDWRQWLTRLLPQRRYELVTILLLSAVSLLPSLQLFLLDQRILVQARYRELTQQIDRSRPASMALIQIDDASIQRDRVEIGQINPMSQKYMARLIDRLVAAKVKVIGLDYLLDHPDPNQKLLANSIRQGTDQGVRFVFGKISTNQGGWIQTPPQVADPRNLHAQAIGSMGTDFHMPQIWPSEPLVISYWLARLHQVCVEPHFATPQLKSLAPAFCASGRTAEQEQLAKSEMAQETPQLYYSAVSSLAYSLAGQIWFHPIIDFSIPAEQVYTAIPAWKLLYEPNAPDLKRLSQQTVLIAAGGYETAGITPGDPLEKFPPPAAVRYWYEQADDHFGNREMTGGEHLSYLFENIMQRRFVMPVPDLLMVWLAAIGAKLVLLGMGRSKSLETHGHPSVRARLQTVSWSGSPIQGHLPPRKLLILSGGTAFYSVLSLQLYLSSAAILLPIGLPTVTFWIYLIPNLLKKQ